MESKPRELTFGPSERYLPGKKLVEGDVLTLNILDVEAEEVDTEFGSKLQFHILVLSSSTEAVKPGKYTWRTVAQAARKVHEYWSNRNSSQNQVKLMEDFSHWVWKLTVVENGIQLKTSLAGLK
jgi:hypothetical protein